MKKILVALLIVVLPESIIAMPQKKSTTFKISLGAALGGNIADGITTEVALRNKNLQEANPFMKSSYARIPLKSAVAGLQMYGLNKLHEKHPKLATGLGIGLGSLFSAVAYNNYRNMKKYE